MAPAEVHTTIYSFLQADFTWKHAKVMRKFAQLLAAAGSTDPRWNQEERANFLTRVTDPFRAGIIRIQDVLCARTSTGSGAPMSLAFVDGMMPVLMFLTSSTVISTTLMSSTNQLYSIIDVHLEKIVNKASEGIETLMQDHGASLAKSDIPSMSQIFKPLVLLLQEYLDRFPMATVQHFDLLQDFLARLLLKLDDWVQAVSTGRFMDGISRLGISKTSHLKFIQDCLKERIKTIQNRLAFANSHTKQLGPGENDRPATSVVGEGQLQMLQRSFDPPGDLRDAGPRHDNDCAHIKDIKVHPTPEEIACSEPPFIPFNFPGAPHHLPQGSPERLLDVQFRLLREELLEPLRTSLVSLSNQLQSLDVIGSSENSKDRSQLSQLLQRGGGRFRAGENAVDLQVWNDGRLRFHDLEASDRYGMLSVVSFQCKMPKTNAYLLDKLLNPGSLVAILTSDGDGGEVDLALGLMKNKPGELKQMIHTGRDPILKIRLFDSVAPRLHFPVHQKKYQILAEVRGVLYESVTPFLEKLQGISADQLPFGQLLATPANADNNLKIPAPRYAQEPGFTFDLSGLLVPGQTEGDDKTTLSMTLDESSQEHARDQLKRRGIVDDSQAEAVVASLTRQVSIIQGPPGTGKSFTGVALINTLLKSSLFPILIVCMTNHALDTMLTKILDQGLTKALVRIGSRSKDERIASYSLEELLKVSQRNEDRASKGAWWRFKEAQKRVSKEVKQVQQQIFSEEEILCWADTSDPDVVEHIFAMPTSMRLACQDWRSWNPTYSSGQNDCNALDVFRFWANGGDITYRSATSQQATRTSSQGIATRASDRHNNRFMALELSESSNDGSDDGSDAPNIFTLDDVLPYEDSETSSDVEDATSSSTHGDKEDASSDAGSPLARTDDDYATTAYQSSPDLNLNESSNHFDILSCADWPAIEHRGNLDGLLRDRNIWTFSQADRALLLERWTAGLRRASIAKLEDECKRYEKAHQETQEHHESQRQRILSEALVVGATTNGAARAARLLKTAKPRVLVVEEAGQVLESHVLATMGPSIEQLILIGDHKQLRPQISNYGLSVDNHRGRGRLHRLDVSLMERLAEEVKLPVSRIVTQRRMIPSICDLIRPIQQLEDHPSVQNRPNIRGLGRNVIFMDHNHPESVQETSRTNHYEADMATDLARHLVNQGYNAPGDICVIVAYLSQIRLVRDRLQKHRITMLLSEKDADALAEIEADDEENAAAPSAVVANVQLSDTVRVATVDNFQGEEARFIILSLVRNHAPDTDQEVAGSRHLRKSGIGFLKSPNRAYVALSRARDGMIVFGNAAMLRAHSPFWSGVLDRFEEQDAIMQAIPIVCDRHPDKEPQYITEPGQLPLIAPNGGCSETCGEIRPCGHVCTAKCHPGDDTHASLPCLMDCIHSLECGHPCPNRCGQKCGPCDFTIPSATLACGHQVRGISCASLQKHRCQEMVQKQVPKCQHMVLTQCATEDDQLVCQELCGEILACCGAKCVAKCHECTRLNVAKDSSINEADDEEDDTSPSRPQSPAAQPVPRIVHLNHRCGKKRPCGHVCEKNCIKGHECQPVCGETCNRRLCEHCTCSLRCWAPCQVCLEKCTWHCEHGTEACLNPCGVPCERIPCDMPCSKMLACGHPCPSVCGEPCELQTCSQCASEDKKAQVVDMIMQTTLGELDTTSTGLDNRTITLSCGHVFTVETLDGIFEMSTFYTTILGKWQVNRCPPSDFFDEYRCPFCRSHAFSMRYGRPARRAFLDFQEKKFIAQSERERKRLEENKDAVDLDDMLRIFRDPPPKGKVAGKRQYDILQKDSRHEFLAKQAQRKMPTNSDSFLNLLHFGFSEPLARAWMEATRPVMEIYRKAEKILKTRNPHLHAWEAAVNQAYTREKLHFDRQDPRRDEKALQMARFSVAMPEPKAEPKYRLHATFTILDLLMKLVNFINRVGEDLKPAEKTRWERLADLLLHCGMQDSKRAADEARDTQYGQEELQAKAYGIRFKSEAVMLRNDQNARRCSKDVNKLQAMDNRTFLMVNEWQDDWCTAVQTFRSQRGARETSKDPSYDLDQDMMQFFQNLRQESFAHRQLRRRQELTMIVTALRTSNLDLQHGGHYYRCSNGHPFVIGNCGGATQLSNCPECGVQIGGQNHRLAEGNTFDHELEEIAREAGAEPSPWTWGRP